MSRLLGRLVEEFVFPDADGDFATTDLNYRRLRVNGERLSLDYVAGLPCPIGLASGPTVF